MTWQHVLRAMMVAFVGAVALALASQARAEGGEGASIVAPESAQSAEAETMALETAEKHAADDKTSDPAVEKTSVKQANAKSKPKKSEERVDAAAKNAADGSKVGQKPADVVKTRVATVAAKGATEAEAPKTFETGATKQANAVEEEVAGAVEIAPSLAKNPRLRAEAERTLALKPLVRRYASENNLPFELADAVIRIESRYNATAKNGPNIGLTQINAATARSLGYAGSAAGLTDAETNIRYGLKYLAMAYRLAGGDTCGTILRYQFGHRTVTMTQASLKYCARVKTIIASAN